MSVVDSRVVQLLFDGAQFAKGVTESQKSLNTLDKQLNTFGGSSRASTAVLELAEKFNRLGIVGVTAIQNITNRITDGLIKTIKSVSVDQISAGFGKYEDKVKSVQTILAATKRTWRQDANDMVISSELVGAGIDKNMIQPMFDLYEIYVDKGKVTAKQMKDLGVSSEVWAQALPILSGSLGYTGTQMEYVSDQLDMLNWFTDETSYSFTDMTSNIGKFTSQGVGLSTAVTAMEGVATWAAAAGQGAGEASRAMYNLSQALGVGAVKLQDWKSIENANMATEQFKEEAIKAAVACGTLTEKAGKYYVKGKNIEVTTKNFSQTLATGWFNSEALLATLDVYGGFATDIGELTASFGELNVSTTDLLEGIKYIEDGIDPSDSNYAAWIEKMTNKGVDIDELMPKLEKLASDEYEIGREAFRAGQEAKTFTDAIDALKDAASTAWMNLFETLFGNYEEAKQIWTELANSGYTIFAEPVNVLNDLLKAIGAGEWAAKAVGWVTKIADAVGVFLDNNYDDIMTGGFWIFQYISSTVKSFVDFVKSIFDPIKEAFQNIFPPKSGAEIANTFAKIIGPVEKFFRIFKANDDTGDKLRRTFEGVFAVFDILLTVFESLWRVFSDLMSEFKGLGGGILDSTASIGDFLVGLRDSLKENDTFYNAIKTVGKVIIPIFKTVFNVVSKVIGLFARLFKSGEEDSESMDSVADAAGKLSDKLSPLATVLENIKSAASKVWEFLKKIYESCKEFISGIDFSKIDFGELLKTGVGVGTGIGAISIFKSIKDFVDNGGLGKGLIEKLEGIVKSLKGVFDSLKGVFKGLERDFNADAMKKIAVALLIFAVAIAAFAFVAQMDGLGAGLALMAGSLALLIGTLKLLEKLKIKKSVTATAASLVTLAVAMLILAAAMAAFALVAKMDSAWEGLGLFAATLVLVVAALYVLGKVGAKVIIAATAMLILSVAMILLAGAIAAFAAVAMMPTFTTGLAIFAGVLILVVAALAVLGEVGAKVIISAVALLVLAAAMNVLALALAAFAAIAMMPTFTTGLAVMILMLVLMVGALTALSAMSAKVIIAAAALLILSVAMLVLAGALAAFAAVAMMDTFGAGLAAMALMILVLVAALVVLGAIGGIVIVGAAALLIAASALLVLSAAVLVCAIALPLLAAGLNALFGAVIGLATAIVNLIFSIITQVAMALVLIATSIAMAVAVLFDGIGQAVAALSSGIGEGIAAVGEGIAAAIEAVIASIGEGIGRGLEGIGSGIEKIGESVSTVGDGIGNVGTGIQQFSDGVKSLKGIAWVETAAGLASIVPPLKDLAKIDLATVQGSIQGIAAGINMIIVQAPMMGVAGTIGVTSIASALTKGVGTVSNAASNLSRRGAAAAKNQTTYWYSAGQNAAQGFINGVNSKITVADLVGSQLAQKLIDAARAKLMESSPSKVFMEIGGYAAEGLAIGVEDKTDMAVRSVEDMALESIGTASDILANAIENDFSNPVIRPTLDLSNVAAGASAIGSMFGDQKVGVDGDLNGSGSGSKSGATYTYVQNNYSPKSLNRMEIYRQTRNQINMKHVLKSV